MKGTAFRALGAELGRDAAAAALLYAGTLFFYVGAARHTGLAAFEPARLHAVGQVAELVRHAADEGKGVLSRAAFDAVLAPLRGTCAAPTFFGGYLSALLAERAPAMAPLLRERMGYLVLSALAVPLLYLLARSALGRRAAIASAALLAWMPYLVHEAGTTSPDTLAVTAWLGVLVPFAAAQKWPRAAWTFSAVTGAAFGLAVNTAPSSAALLAVLPAYFAGCRARSWFRQAKQGHARLPLSLVAMLTLGPLFFVLSSPWFWFDTADRLRDWLIVTLAPVIAPTLYRGATFSALPLPYTLGPVLLLVVTPLSTLVLAGIGAYRLMSAKRTSAAPHSDEHALGMLAAVGLFFTVVWPAVAPQLLLTFPPRVVLALPFLALLGGAGFDHLVHLLEPTLPAALSLPPRRWALATLGASLTLVPGLVQASHDWATGASAFSPLAGGVAGVVRGRLVSAWDASGALPAASAIDRLDRAEISIFSPAVPGEVWDGLRTYGLMRTHVRPAATPAGADLVAVSVEKAEPSIDRQNRPPLAVVTRDGVPLFRLYDRER